MPTRSSPPRVRSPKLVQGALFAFRRRSAMRHWIGRYGHVFELNIPFFGRSVVVSDPALVRSVCGADAGQLANVQPNLSNLFGPGSIFALDGTGHGDRRRLLAPAFHGSSLRAYETVVESETLRESATWPEDTEFRILEPMKRITLNVILRTLFGVDNAELAELRELIPPYMTLGQLLAFAPAPPPPVRHYSPWGKLDELRTPLDRIIGALVDRAAADPGLNDRSDVLAGLLRARRGDGSPVSRCDIGDELLTLIVAGHETTATALAWTFERLRRHPAVLAELVSEVDSDGSEFRRATIAESLRARTVLDVTGRRVTATHFDLGGWRIPHGRTVLVRIADLHENPQLFPHPEHFDPYRFDRSRPAPPAWLAFGGGTRRCPGADFAVTEMDIVLRTVLRHFSIHTDASPDEKSHFRGVAHTPKLGGRVAVTRRT